VTRQIPTYIRLHQAEDAVSKPRGAKDTDVVRTFWSDFAASTGWSIAKGATSNSIRLQSTVGIGAMMSTDEMVDQPTISHDDAMQLARSGFELARQLTEARAALGQREAKLAELEATYIHTAEDPREPAPSRPLADRITDVLKDGTAAMRCDAAGLYLLDDQTSQLKLRVAHGLADNRLIDPPRQLRGSLADLEALVGGVVTMDAALLTTQWTSPEPCGAAMCLAVTVSGNPVGTIWFWSTEDRQFDGSAQAAAKLTARLVAQELTADTQTRRLAKATKAVRPLRAAAAWQQRQQPIHHTPDQGWSLSGWTESPIALASSWFYWDVLPDGMLAMILADAHGQGYESAMIAATARAAWQAHSGYRHDPAQMLRRISDTLWQTNTGDQLLSCFYAQINPETGEGSMASAGQISGLVAGRFGFRPLIEQTQPIGTQIDLRPRLQHLQIAPSETLYVYTPGLVDCAGGEPSNRHLNQQRLADIVRQQRGADAESHVAAIRRSIAGLDKPRQDRTVMACLRRPTHQ
jgi:hypothetical protein